MCGGSLWKQHGGPAQHQASLVCVVQLIFLAVPAGCVPARPGCLYQVVVLPAFHAGLVALRGGWGGDGAGSWGVDARVCVCVAGRVSERQARRTWRRARVTAARLLGLAVAMLPRTAPASLGGHAGAGPGAGAGGHGGSAGAVPSPMEQAHHLLTAGGRRRRSQRRRRRAQRQVGSGAGVASGLDGVDGRR